MTDYVTVGLSLKKHPVAFVRESLKAKKIITAMPNRNECKVGGVGTSFFDAQGKCTQAGITCLVGYPASQAQLDICNQILSDASTPSIGKNLAVGVIAAAAFTCE